MRKTHTVKGCTHNIQRNTHTHTEKNTLIDTYRDMQTERDTYSERHTSELPVERGMEKHQTACLPSHGALKNSYNIKQIFTLQEVLYF